LSGFKRIVLYVGLLVFTIWPVAQIGLVKRHDVNPWKLAGWGMYSAPQLPGDVRVLCHTPDAVGTYELRTIQPELQPVLLSFLQRRLGLGRLAEPDELARALFDFYPAIDGVSIDVLQPVLDRHTGMIVEETSTYSFPR
jgi:hypothetical protein